MFSTLAGMTRNACCMPLTKASLHIDLVRPAAIGTHAMKCRIELHHIRTFSTGT